MSKNDMLEALRAASKKYVKRHYYKIAWEAEMKTFIAGANWALKQIDKGARDK